MGDMLGICCGYAGDGDIMLVGGVEHLDYFYIYWE